MPRRWAAGFAQAAVAPPPQWTSMEVEVAPDRNAAGEREEGTDPAKVETIIGMVSYIKLFPI